MLALDLGAGVSLELVLVRAGRFRQGSPATEAGRADDEAEREVTLTRDFYAGKLEVTVGQFRRFAEETRYRTEAEKGSSGGFGWDGKALVQAPRYTWRDPGFPQTDRHPVTIVTHDDALAFAAWLSRRTGRPVRLPSEAEWEYAARGGSRARFSSGEAEDSVREIGWFKANAGGGTHPAGEKKPNGFGLYDTAGNVYEWCRDWYAPYLPGPVTDPEESRSTLSDKPRRVLRGGSWLKGAGALRSAARYRNAPGSRNADNGLRVVAEVVAAAAAPAPTAAGTGTAARGAGTAAPEAGKAAPFAGLAFLGGLAAFVWGLLRLLRRGRMSARIQPDGFRIDARHAKAGQKIRYRYMADGRTQVGEITVAGEPGQGVFVYTGGTPSNVEILGLAETGVTTAPPSPSRPKRAQTRRDDDTPPFRGYPSAY